MKTKKLVLKLDKDVIEKAKKYAASNRTSLSKLVESYLRSLTIEENTDDPSKIQISEFVKSMSTGIHVPADIDYKKELAKILCEKYL